jgi:anti-anti-sigma factor
MNCLPVKFGLGRDWVWDSFSPAGGLAGSSGDAYGLECEDVFCIRVDRLVGDVVVIVGVGEIDSITAPRLSAALHRELEHTPASLVLDLTGVSFLGVAGLHVLDCALARAGTLSVTLNLIYHDHSAVQSALRAAAMTGLFPAFCSVALACAPSS